MAKSNSGLGCLIALVVLGFFMLFYNRFMFFSPMFIMIIIGIVMISIIFSSISRRGSYERNIQYREKNSNVSNQRTLRNPYINHYVQDSSPRKVQEFNEDFISRPENSRYCQYCGVKREEGAIYCHNCGTKLTLD